MALENEFDEFLVKENLSVWTHNSKCFTDIKYNFRYIHEINSTLEDDYEDVYLKYSLRIKKFYKAIQHKTCFIRTVMDENELDFIVKNHKQINSIIRKCNNENTIIYLIYKDLIIPSTFKEHYYITEFRQGTTYDTLRNIFDKSEDFISYCLENYDTKLQSSNLLFDLKKENLIFKKRKSTVKYSRYTIHFIIKNS